MDSEKLLHNLFKQRHYDLVWDNIHKLLLIIGIIASSCTAALTLLLGKNSSVLFIVLLFCFLAVFLLIQLKKISRKAGSVLIMGCLCFIYTPLEWYLTSGFEGPVPYISILAAAVILFEFSGVLQKRLLLSYFAVLALLTAYSCYAASVAGTLPAMLSKPIAFIIAVTVVCRLVSFLIRKSEETYDRSLNFSIMDELTGVMNRRVLDMVIEYEESLFNAHKKDYIVVMFDVDHFKKLNDDYGHVVGDIIIRNIALCIRENVRKSDFVIRYGGDEFLMIQTNVSSDNIHEMADRIQKAIKEKHVLDLNLRLSYGFAKRSECKSPTELISLSDKRMYENKEAHR